MGDKTQTENMTGILRGPDGKLSGRRLLGTIALAWAGVLETIAQIQGLASWVGILPGAVLALAGLILWGLVSWQNIRDAAAILKGKSAP